MSEYEPVTILRRSAVEARTGLARSTIYDLMKGGSFPAPVNLGPRSVGWVQTDIDAWIASRVKQTRYASSEKRA